MQRIFLSALFLLLLYCPLQAQSEKEIFRAITRLETTGPKTSLLTNTEQVIRQVAQEQARAFAKHTRTYLLSSLPKNIPSSITLPAFPLPPNERNMYRGMVLNSPTEELKHILKNGLEASKCQAANFASYDGINSSWAAAAVFASTDPDLALGYTHIHLKESGMHFPVLFHLKRLGNSLFVSVPHDIPPQWIEHVSTVLSVDGALRWGELTLDEYDHFVFTPYSITQN